jgi:hypothetical protein
MVVIMETRCDPNKLQQTFKLLGFDGFLATEAYGFSGGIVTAWKEDCISVVLENKKFQYMHLRVQLQNGSTWFFTPTYASPNEDNRGLL